MRHILIALLLGGCAGNIPDPEAASDAAARLHEGLVAMCRREPVPQECTSAIGAFNDLLTGIGAEP